MGKKTIIVAVLAAVASVSAYAGLIIDTIDSSYGVVGANGGVADTGFTFTANGLGADTRLDTIAVATAGTENGATEFTLQVYVDSDGDSSTWGLGSLVGTSDAQVLNSSTQAISTFSFASLPVLTEGQVYAVRYGDATGTSAATGMRYFGVSSNQATSKTVTGGQIFNNSAAIFDRGAPIEVVTVPEPVSLALAIGGIVSVAVMRRRFG